MYVILLAFVLGQTLSTPPGVALKDEGVSQGRVSTIDCVGSSVTCTRVGSTGTLSVTGGSGSANAVAVTVDFTSNGSDGVATVVSGQTWVTATSVIVCSPTMLATATRAEGAEDAVIESLTVAIYNRLVGTGFTLRTWAAVGKAYGQFIVHCTGV